MPLTLHVDAPAWRRHTAAFVRAHPGLVPVVKGNGYGFGHPILAAEAARLGVTAVAAGTYEEVTGLLTSWPDTAPTDVLVLTPWRPFLPEFPEHPRVVHTLSRLSDLRLLAGSGRRAVVEVRTSMQRHGLLPEEVPEAAAALDGVGFEGWSMHLPLAGDVAAEARRLASLTALTADRPGHRLWVSHLDAEQRTALAAETGAEVRLRSGTGLWLGERRALSMRATVLDSHPLRKGTPAGYRLRRAPSEGTLLVVAGGTAHGVGLAAPTPVSGLRQASAVLARGAVAAGGRTLSPFRIAGRRRWFFEPPHMQVSMVWLPAGVTAPDVGEDVPVDVRFTTTTADRVLLEEPALSRPSDRT